MVNDWFVPVKVDREERPDVDAIYMEAVQAMTGHGGWPMTVFLAPDGRPFFGGTYFPRERRGGMPSFLEICRAVDEHWRTNREALDEQAGRLTAAIGQLASLAPAVRSPGPGGPRPGGGAARGGARSRAGEASAGPRSSPRPCRSSCCCATTSAAGDAHQPRGGADLARRDGRGRHLRPSRRRLRPLLHRRPLARAALREDAVRQRAAHPGLHPRLAADRAKTASARSWRSRSATCCATSPSPPAASPRRRMPTARARRGGSTSGRSRRWPTSVVRTASSGTA